LGFEASLEVGSCRVVGIQLEAAGRRDVDRLVPLPHEELSHLGRSLSCEIEVKLGRTDGVLLGNRRELADHHLDLVRVLLLRNDDSPLPLCVELDDLVGLAKLERCWYVVDLLVRLGGFVVAAEDEDVLVVVQSDDRVAETASEIDALHRLDLDLGLSL